MAQSTKELIFAAKNEYSDFVVTNAELYDATALNDGVDQTISEAEAELKRGARPISLEVARKQLDGKFHK